VPVPVPRSPVSASPSTIVTCANSQVDAFDDHYEGLSSEEEFDGSIDIEAFIGKGKMKARAVNVKGKGKKMLYGRSVRRWLGITQAGLHMVKQVLTSGQEDLATERRLRDTMLKTHLTLRRHKDTDSNGDNNGDNNGDRIKPTKCMKLSGAAIKTKEVIDIDEDDAALDRHELC
ncbi:hypothetical protein EW145_g8401, partial [Phellinidium pouzarii]